ncbi:MAG: alpha-amylase family glycosyl hydrolase [bacterium]|nr:alpha-amylase family glycosyl hydrolase [bacterium]
MVNWFKNAVIYHIFIDRFSRGKTLDEKPVECTGPVFCGGNLLGVIERLDYLQNIGINTIWLSPFNKTSAYHGYHVTDFFDVDPHFGSLETVQRLVGEACDRGIRILMDFVPNHVSHQHPYFLDAQSNKSSQYRNWFYFTRWPEKYLCFLSYRELPKINLDDAAARDHIVKAAKYWLGMGISGFCLDHVVGPKHSFWRYFRKAIKKEYPDAVLIGEACISGIKLHELRTINIKRKYIKWVLGPVSDGLLKEYIGELDGVLDFEFQRLVKEFIAKPSFLKPIWLFRWKLKQHYKSYPPGFYLPTFLDNHDMNRFLFEASQDKNKLKEAVRVQFSQEQPPIIFYGTEIGLTQERDMSAFKEYGDLVTRNMMLWQEEKQDKTLLTFYKSLIRERRRQTVVGRNLRVGARKIKNRKV